MDSTKISHFPVGNPEGLDEGLLVTVITVGLTVGEMFDGEVGLVVNGTAGLPVGSLGTFGTTGLEQS